MESLKTIIRDIPDFPKKGIIFKDITPLLADPAAFAKVINTLRDRYKDKNITAVAGIEARGFIFSASLAYALGCGVVVIRKPGKLPYKTYTQTYALEYGEDAIEIHQDAFQPGQNILLIDDVLATGGTMAAAANLVKTKFEVNLVEIAFLIELDFLKGREKLKGYNIHSLLHY